MDNIPSITGGNINADKMPILIAIGIVILAFICVIIYISFVLKSSNLKGKRLLSEPLKIDELKTPFVAEAVDIPRPVSGREYTYSFWIYVDQFSQTQSGKPQMIFYRGSQTSIADANPIVMMDGTTNKLYMVIKTQGSQLSSTDRTFIDYDSNLKNILDRSYFMNKDVTLLTPNSHKHIIIPIDYVPLQRWVNIAFVVDNKLITIFLDGEIYSVKSVDEYKMTKAPEFDARGNVKDYNIILDPTIGNVYAGKYGINDVANSYLSNLQFFNYAISLNDIKAVYKAGPFPKSWLSYLGINQYGLRSPIYPLYEQQKK